MATTAKRKTTTKKAATTVKKKKKIVATTSKTLKALYNAYQYEQLLIAAWEQDMVNPLPPNAGNQMQVLFAQTWSRYFQLVHDSNDFIIKHFEKIRGWPDNMTQADMDNFAKHFNGKEHDPKALQSVGTETGKQAAGADADTRYFEKLDKLIGLEVEVRDAMSSFIT